MSATNSLETGLLGLIFNGDTIANIADNTATSPATSFWISLHTADPGEAGNQSTSETTYGGYSRQEVTRNSSGFTVSGNEVSNASAIQPGLCTSLGSAQTLTHFGIGLSETGTGTLLFTGALTASIPMQENFAPYFPAGTLTTDCD